MSPRLIITVSHSVTGFQRYYSPLPGGVYTAARFSMIILFSEKMCIRDSINITPHMGEMSRLTSVPIVDLKKDPLGEARAYSARYGTVCVLKDAVTVVTDKDGAAWINQSGCSAMAKGGSGAVSYTHLSEGAKAWGG